MSMYKTFNYKNSAIAYSVQGQGKPVVLLHGFGETSAIYTQQIDYLQEHCLLIIPDLPGSGNSTLLKNSEEKNNLTVSVNYPASLNDYADCIATLLAHEKIYSCTLLGHSMGGYITMAFAERHNNLLNAFGLIHSTAYADNETKKENRIKGIEMVEEYGCYAFLKTVIPNLFGEAFKQAYPEKINELIETSKLFEKDALQQYYFAMHNRPDRRHILKESKVPIMLIAGTEDTVAPINDIIEQATVPQQCYIHVLEKVGHMGMWEATNKMNEYLLQFINR
ncbi:MAG: alpha/beta hydrolase [Chitinophagaceae bacterium]|nr:alpha/beta hydrolase [Chitinophagaceae bacterium]MCW5904952.1 alpha/beta hydrolase [Chitinophagaceae bacterium]